MSGLSNGMQALMMLVAFLVPLLATVGAWSALGMPTDRASVGLLVSSICGDLSAGIIVFAKEILGGKPAETESSTSQSQGNTITRLLRGNNVSLQGAYSPKQQLRSFVVQFYFNTSAIFGHGGYKDQYDPDPGRRRHKRRRAYDPGRRSKGHRKGVEPAGLRRWRLANRRTHDPGYQRSLWKGRRGGHYFQGPRKRRYDPAPRRRFGRVRRYGSKVEGTLSKYGTLLGLALGLGGGFYQAYQNMDAYMKKGGFGPAKPDPTGATDTFGRYRNILIGSKDGPPEIAHLWTTTGLWNPLSFLKYKFLGIDPADTTGKMTTNSAWVLPFWVSFGAWIATSIGMKVGKLGKLHRFMRPINKIAKGATIGTFIGALALPGCGNVQPNGTLPPPPPNVVNMVQNPQNKNNYQIGGAF